MEVSWCAPALNEEQLPTLLRGIGMGISHICGLILMMMI